jgi:PPK2 family polyphosphate:nucleotide phosphotransferase
MGTDGEEASMAKANRAGMWIADPAQLLKVGPGFGLAEVPTDATPGFDGGKAAGKSALKADSAVLAELQELLWANSALGDERRLLLVLQAMDTAGKGGVVKHVIGSVDPQGVQFAAFKKPTDQELQHDFLWRVHKEVPGAGTIGVFDRSHYEDVLIARVRELAPAAEIERRYEAINQFERQLVDSGTTIVKVMLHIGSSEQRSRLQARLDDPQKHWKYNPGDLDERMLLAKYLQAYQVAFERTSTEYAPWYVVPADRKWYARLAVQQLLIEALQDMTLAWPTADYDVKREAKRLAST